MKNLCEFGRTPLNACLLCKSTQNRLSQQKPLGDGRGHFER